MKRLFLSCVLFTILCSLTFAQEKRAVAIMPFIASAQQDKGTAAQLQDIVLQILSSKPSVEVVDRSKDTMVVTELDNQIREVSVAAKGLAAQGKLQGALEIIVGTITKADAEPVGTTTTVSGVVSKNNQKYTGIVTFSLQLIDVETGLVKQQETFTGRTGGTDAANKTSKGLKGFLKAKYANTLSTATEVVMPDTKEKALLAALHSSEDDISDWINKIYAPDVQILSIEEREKGYPETVLVAGLDASVKKGTTIEINEIQYFTLSSGKQAKQVKKIAALKVKEMQGETTLCKVTEGETTLEEKMKGKNKLEFTIK